MPLPTLEDLLAGYRSDVDTLRRYGHAPLADTIKRICDDVTRSAEAYMRFLPESEAMLRSGHRLRWLRAQYPKWATEGHAKTERGMRSYREMVIPVRQDLVAAREAGRKAGRAALGKKQ